MAASETNLILNIPFDEPNGSNVAYDFAQGRNDAAVEGGKFVNGKQGNCIRFDGKGVANIESDIVPLSGNFTILAWVKVNNFPDGFTGRKIGLFCNTNEIEGYKVVWMEIAPESWGFITVKKEGSAIRLYLDTQLVSTFTLSEELTGIALIQDIYATEYAYADIDEVKIYNVVLTDDELAEEISNVSQLEYYIDGVNFKDYDIRVESSAGVLDLPKMKAPASVNWDDYHGEVLDLTDKRYQAREITLNCWMRANGKINFAEKINRFYEHFMKDGTQRLMISIHPTKPLVYEVYCPDGIAPSKRWHDDKMIGTFSLKLKEPDPVKRVVRHQRVGSSSAEITIALKSDKMVNIYWGDGEVTQDVYGDFTGDKALTHTYAANGIYYVVIAGVVEEITDFSTNGIIVWNKL